MIYQYNELNAQFGYLLEHAPVKKAEVLPTLFDIAGFPHYERVVSNVYAFFFQTENPHGLGPLFLNALTYLISQKGFSPPIFGQERCCCRREWRTKQGNFIDLVLYDEIDKSRRVTNALIIENKIYATVYNDLNDYFTDVPLNLENNGQKLGVVLTLKPIKLDSRYANQYVNITHAELLGRVRETIGVQLLRATDRYQLLLQDFFANIFNLYTPTHMDESVKFYYDHATRIKELLVLDKHVEVQVINAIQREVELLGFLVNRNNTFELTLRFEAYPEVLTYLKFNDLLEKQTVIVTMWSEGRKKEAWLRLPNLQVLAQGNHASIQLQPQKRSEPRVALATLNIEPKNYAGIEQAPRQISEYLKTHWLPFLRHFNQTLAASLTL